MLSRDEFYPVAGSGGCNGQIGELGILPEVRRIRGRVRRPLPGTCEESEAWRQGSGRHQVPARSGEVAAHHPPRIPRPRLLFPTLTTGLNVPVPLSTAG